MEYQQLTSILLLLQSGLCASVLLLIYPTIKEIRRAWGIDSINQFLIYILFYTLVPISAYISFYCLN